MIIKLIIKIEIILQLSGHLLQFVYYYNMARRFLYKNFNFRFVSRSFMASLPIYCSDKHKIDQFNYLMNDLLSDNVHDVPVRDPSYSSQLDNFSDKIADYVVLKIKTVSVIDNESELKTLIKIFVKNIAPELIDMDDISFWGWSFASTMDVTNNFKLDFIHTDQLFHFFMIFSYKLLLCKNISDLNVLLATEFYIKHHLTVYNEYKEEQITKDVHITKE